jgi:hypothetical protein
MTPLTLADFDYSLPPELIAQHPARVRSSRLLTSTATAWSICASPTATAAAGDLLVFNDTRVINALRGRKSTGGEVEVDRRITGPDTAVARLRASHPPRPARRSRAAGVHAIVHCRKDRSTRCSSSGPTRRLLARPARRRAAPVHHAPIQRMPSATRRLRTRSERSRHRRPACISMR